ncbi:hypothetical protein GCM10010254_22320 [Streptomyces chromofuscus]|nr:hypothetical protein GCM10010254_22320 [Streptomyces chromofuscus]
MDSGAARRGRRTADPFRGSGALVQARQTPARDQIKIRRWPTAVDIEQGGRAREEAAVGPVDEVW